MAKNNTAPEQHTASAHFDNFRSLPTEEEITELVEEFEISYEQAKAILQENRFLGRPRSIVAVSREEFDELQEEIARSGQNRFIFGKKKSADEEQQEDT